MPYRGGYWLRMCLCQLSHPASVCKKDSLTLTWLDCGENKAHWKCPECCLTQGQQWKLYSWCLAGHFVFSPLFCPPMSGKLMTPVFTGRHKAIMGKKGTRYWAYLAKSFTTKIPYEQGLETCTVTPGRTWEIAYSVCQYYHQENRYFFVLHCYIWKL